MAFIISIETEASLLALAKSIYYYISSLSSRMTAARHAALGMSAKPSKRRRTLRLCEDGKAF